MTSFFEKAKKVIEENRELLEQFKEWDRTLAFKDRSINEVFDEYKKNREKEHVRTN